MLLNARGMVNEQFVTPLALLIRILCRGEQDKMCTQLIEKVTYIKKLAKIIIIGCKNFSFGRSRFIKVSILIFSGVVKFILMSSVCSDGAMLLSIAVVDILVLVRRALRAGQTLPLKPGACLKLVLSGQRLMNMNGCRPLFERVFVLNNFFLLILQTAWSGYGVICVRVA